MYKKIEGTEYIEGVHYDFLRLASGKTTKVGFEDRRDLGTRVDMHVHSTASDGTLEPEEIVRLAILSNVRTLVLTDHDTLIGSKKIMAGSNRGLELFSGIELSALVRKGKSRIHILGYDFDLDSKEINKAVEYVDKCSEYNFKLYIRCLEEKFPEINIPNSEIEKILEFRRKTGKNIGRVDIAQLLIRYGYGTDPNHEFPSDYSSQDIVFEKYLNPIKYHVQEEKIGISEEECIRTIKKANGLVSLAHPSSLKLSNPELEQRIVQYKKWGLDALEVYHPSNTEEQRKFYYHLARKYELLVSGGTDYHGYEVKPHIILGHGKNGNIDLREEDLSLVKELRKRH